MSQNRKGYVNKDYISFVCSSMAISQTDVPSTDPGSVGAAIAISKVNVRSGPGTNYKKLGKLRTDGSRVEHNGQMGGNHMDGQSKRICAYGLFENGCGVNRPSHCSW